MLCGYRHSISHSLSNSPRQQNSFLKEFSNTCKGGRGVSNCGVMSFRGSCFTPRSLNSKQSWHYIYIYIYKVVISVCLFVCPIITQKPLGRFASNLIGELGRATEILLVGFEIISISWVGRLLFRKFSFLVKSTRCG